jgi:hypothetical protein
MTSLTDMGPAIEESIPPREQAEIDALIERLRSMMAARDAGGTQRRDVHVKTHALVRAEFSVLDLPPELRVGLFARPGTYKAWVRFSSSANTVNRDHKGDIRGMAIKLMGVPGRKMLTSQAEAATHDFVLISAPNFPSRTPGQFDALVAAVLGSVWGKLRYFVTHPRVAWMLLTTMVKHANVLQIPYYSAVPYAFGALAAKYVAIPRVDTFDAMPSNRSANFLRDACAQQLSKGEWLFDFAVQFQRDEATMPIEDPSRAWSLELSPPHVVATLRILQQSSESEAIDAQNERLSFTPWHCLPEHRPLGAINRARRAIYETLSQFRHEANQVPWTEPVDWNV